MKSYPVGLTWETKGYHCTILSTEPRSQNSEHWLSHNVEWNPKREWSAKHVKQMSTKKLEKEFRRLGISPEPEQQIHFEEDLFSV